MNFLKAITKISKYAIVGGLAATTHAISLLILSNYLPLWTSNLSGFLLASCISYLGHSIFTFRKATNGNRFAKRWLIFQFILNIIVCLLLPIILSSVKHLPFTTWIFVLSPTLINALIWSNAARFSFIRIYSSRYKPIIHADDLGLSNATNKAIFSLAKNNELNSASILINGAEVESAIKDWQEKFTFPLTLHVCLTEGKAVSSQEGKSQVTNSQGILNQSFGKLILYSLLPKNNSNRISVENQIKKEISAQINLFKELTSYDSIWIDGHQHIHLIPIVLDVILNLSKGAKVTWLRTTFEPIPTGVSLNYWKKSILQGGLIKWFVLQLLTILAKPRIKQAQIKTNAGFAGILFTGQMIEQPLFACFKELQTIEPRNGQTPSILLTHPAAEIDYKDLDNKKLLAFELSKKFISSSLRQKEWDELKRLKLLSDYSSLGSESF